MFYQRRARPSPSLKRSANGSPSSAATSQGTSRSSSRCTETALSDGPTSSRPGLTVCRIAEALEWGYSPSIGAKASEGG